MKTYFKATLAAATLIWAALAGTAVVAQQAFTTAEQVRPILEATRGNWVAVREYEGQDWLYVTHLWSWRCAMSGIAVGLNGQKPEIWPLPPCHHDLSTPNAVLEEDGLPTQTYPLGSVQSIDVLILMNDGTSMNGSFARNQVRIP